MLCIYLVAGVVQHDSLHAVAAAVHHRPGKRAAPHLRKVTENAPDAPSNQTSGEPPAACCAIRSGRPPAPCRPPGDPPRPILSHLQGFVRNPPSLRRRLVGSAPAWNGLTG
eukprot:1192787-Prorocentrum_minimum.AAC.3